MPAPSEEAPGRTVMELEKELILSTLKRLNGNRTHAAKALGSLRAHHPQPASRVSRALGRRGMMDQIFGSAVEHLTRGLTYATARHSLLAQNVANVETPGYQARDLVFEDFLKPPRQPGPRRHCPRACPRWGRAGACRALVLAADADGRADGNDVQLHRQMARLAENTLYQHTLVQLLDRTSSTR